jgi:hypothetical protein
VANGVRNVDTRHAYSHFQNDYLFLFEENERLSGTRGQPRGQQEW